MRHETDIQGKLDAMTLAEQVSLLSGATMWLTAAVERVGVPSVKFTDGPNGARGEGLQTGVPAAAFPCGIALAATWNTSLIQDVGSALAVEARRKGARLLLAPTLNMQRTTLNGRNFECYSEDPVLAGEIGAAYVRGVQSQGVGATPKHFIGNESEFERYTISSEIDERVLREVYLVPFERAVKDAGAWALMGSYNKLNGVGTCESATLLTGILRDEWHWDGMIMSDWWATGSTSAALRAGLDLEMPGPTRFRGEALVKAVETGDAQASDVRRSAERVLRLADRVGAFADPVIHPEAAVDSADDRALIRRAGAEAMVLLQNNGVLPLKDDVRLALFGPNAQQARIMGGGSAMLHPHYAISPADGLRAALGDANVVGFEAGATNHRVVPLLEVPMTIEYFNNIDLQGAPVHTGVSPTTNIYWISTVADGVDYYGFSARAKFTFAPTESGKYQLGLAAVGGARLYLDGELIADAWTGFRPGYTFMSYGGPEMVVEHELLAGRSYELTLEYAGPANMPVPVRAMRVGVHLPLAEAALQAAAELAAKADVAVVFAGYNGEWDSEGMDRPGITLPGQQDELIRRVAAANKRTVVVLQTGSPVATPWSDEVAAIVQAWYPGQECGNAIADVLLGRAEPGGRLPQTFPKRVEDDATRIGADTYPGQDGKVRYTEGLFFGYRHHDRSERAVQFAFGHGLSYTTFDYGPARLDGVGSMQIDPGQAIEVQIDIRNAGARVGSEVVQLYVRDVESSQPRPVKELKTFAKLTLRPGETRTVHLTVAMRDLAFFDLGRRAWIAEAGRFELMIGASSADIRSKVTIELSRDWVEAV